MKQYDAPVLALTQESNNLNVHKSDLVQVYEYANAVMVYLSPYVAYWPIEFDHSAAGL